MLSCVLVKLCKQVTRVVQLNWNCEVVGCLVMNMRDIASTILLPIDRRKVLLVVSLQVRVSSHVTGINNDVIDHQFDAVDREMKESETILLILLIL